MKLPIFFLALLLASAPGVSAQARRGQGSAAPTSAAAAEPQPSPFELLHAQPFVLRESYVHTWRKDQPRVRSGYVLVLRAELELITPRQTLEPVLYVGGQTAERANAPRPQSGPTGQLVVIVPAPLDEQGQVDLDPWSTPTFFGTPMLPEEVDAAVIRRELVRANRMRLPAARRPQIPQSASSGALGQRRSPTLQLVNRAELNVAVADLIEFYSPLEVDLVRELRLPAGRH